MAKIAEYNAPVEKLRPSDAGYSASETAARQIRVSYNEAGTADREVGTLANDLARTIAQEQREAGASRVLGLHGSGGGRVGVTKNYFGSGRDAASGFSRLTGLAANAIGQGTETDVYPDQAFETYLNKADAMYSNTAIGQPGYQGPNPLSPGNYDTELAKERADPNSPLYTPGATPSYQKLQEMSLQQRVMQENGVTPETQQRVALPDANGNLRIVPVGSDDFNNYMKAQNALQQTNPFTTKSASVPAGPVQDTGAIVAPPADTTAPETTMPPPAAVMGMPDVEGQ